LTRTAIQSTRQHRQQPVQPPHKTRRIVELAASAAGLLEEQVGPVGEAASSDSLLSRVTNACDGLISSVGLTVGAACRRP